MIEKGLSHARSGVVANNRIEGALADYVNTNPPLKEQDNRM